MLPIVLIARHIHGHSRRKAHAFLAVSWPMRPVTDCTPRWVETAGHVFVAEHDGAVVGFMAVLPREPFTELDSPPGTYALVSDLVVLSPYRWRGIGTNLLRRAEAFAREADARALRIGVLGANGEARRLYLAAEFVPHLEIFAKHLS